MRHALLALVFAPPLATSALALDIPAAALRSPEAVILARGGGMGGGGGMGCMNCGGGTSAGGMSGGGGGGMNGGDSGPSLFGLGSSSNGDPADDRGGSGSHPKRKQKKAVPPRPGE